MLYKVAAGAFNIIIIPGAWAAVIAIIILVNAVENPKDRY